LEGNEEKPSLLFGDFAMVTAGSLGRPFPHMVMATFIMDIIGDTILDNVFNS